MNSHTHTHIYIYIFIYILPFISLIINWIFEFIVLVKLSIKSFVLANGIKKN